MRTRINASATFNPSVPERCSQFRRQHLEKGIQLPPPPDRPPSPLLSIRRDDTMLRQTLARSAWRNGRQAAANASRAFSATAQRPAEVELTIGALRSSYGK